MTNPTLISVPFAQDGEKNAIPLAGASEPQFATMTGGFPDITERPISEGGIPPERADFNGLGYLTTSHLEFLNKGNWYEFDQEFSISIGGYPLNARLRLTNGDIVKSTVDGNTNDPNVNISGWVLTNSADQISIGSNKTQADKNNLTVDLLDFIPKSEWPLILNRTSSYDCTPALVSSVATGKKVTIGQSGTYKLNTAYIGNTNFDLEATAPDVVLDGTLNTSPYIISNSGGVTKSTATFTNPIKYDISVTLSDVSGLKQGDWLCFYCPTDFSYSQWRDEYRAGEWKQIRAIIGNIVWFTQPFYATYTGLTLDLYKLNSVTCKITNVKLSRSSGIGFAKFSLSSNAIDKDVELDLKTNSGIYYDRCVSPKTIRSKGINAGINSDDYGVVFGNCQHGRAIDVDLYSRRHAIMLGGNAEICCVPVSDFRCYDSILRSDPAAAVGAADMHGNTRDSSYEDCVIYNGTNIGGGDETYYKRCKIYSTKDGDCGFGREIVGGDMGWIDCEYHLLVDPNTSGKAVLTFGANDIVTITEKTVGDCTIHASGKVFSSVAFSSNTNFMTIRNRGSVKKINPKIDGLELYTTAKFTNLLVFNVTTAGVADSDGIIIDNLSGNYPVNLATIGTVLAGQTYINFPMRLQKCAGKIPLTTTASTQLVASAVNLPFTYPRTPSSFLSVRGVNGANKATIGGQALIGLSVYSQTASSIRPAVTSPSAMTAGDNFWCNSRCN